MLIVAYIVVTFTLIQLIIALVNLLPGASMPDSEEIPKKLVSVLIPARNEEKNIGTILNDLREQEYTNIEIIVYDDQSDDRTGEIIKKAALSDKRISFVSGEELPEGWLGKNYACHSLSKHSSGDFLLFLDADVRITNNTIGKAVSLSEKYGLALISIFPKQDIVTRGERMTVPNMNYILLSLLPLILVMKTRFMSLSAANGQFMFFTAGVYHSHKPHQLMKGDRVEDISISRYLKGKKSKIACLLGDDGITCRMYIGFVDAVKGFSKNVIAFFGNSFLLASMFWLITTFGFLPVILFLPGWVILVYFTAYIMIRIFISIASRQNIISNLLNICPLQFSMGLFIYNAFMNKYFREFQWKGRNIK